MNTVEGSPTAASIAELMYRVLETDQGALDLYLRAVRAAQREALRARWRDGGTRLAANVAVATHVLARLQVDPTEETFGRQLVRNVTRVLAQNVEAAITFCTPPVAEIVAARAVLQIESSVQLNWSLVEALAARVGGEPGWMLRDAMYRAAAPDRRYLLQSTSWLQALTVAEAGGDAELPPTGVADDEQVPLVARSPTPVRVSFSRSGR